MSQVKVSVTLSCLIEPSRGSVSCTKTLRAVEITKPGAMDMGHLVDHVCHGGSNIVPLVLFFYVLHLVSHC